MVPSRGPGRIVSEAPPWQNPLRVRCPAGRVMNRPCSGPGSSSSSAKPSASASSGPGSGKGSGSTRHAPFGRNERGGGENIITYIEIDVTYIRKLVLAGGCGTGLATLAEATGGRVIRCQILNHGYRLGRRRLGRGYR